MHCVYIPNELSIGINEKDIITMTQTVLRYGTASLGNYELRIYQDKVIVSFTYVNPIGPKTPLRINREKPFTLKNPKFIGKMDNITKQHLINKIKTATRLLNTATNRMFIASSAITGEVV